MHFADLISNTFSTICLVATAAAFLSLALYYGLIYLRVGQWKGRRQQPSMPLEEEKLPTVSVVLVAHNEGEYLRENLVYLLEQDYPKFEVIVVDYRSEDDTKFVLQVCGDNYPCLKSIRVDQDVTWYIGKKYPLSIGIRSASGDVVLLTEPDSVPKDFGWIRAMVEGYARNADIVLGYSGIKQSKGMLNALMQYDNLSHQSHALGLAMMGHPYTGSGRNLSYKRQFFFDRGAFTRHYTEPQGADDLFVNQNANRRNTALVLSPAAYTLAEPQPTRAAWRLQRRGRYASRRFYPVKDLLSVAFHPLVVALYYAAGILLALRGTLGLLIFAAATVLLWAWHIVSYSMVCKRFEVRRIHWFAPVMEIYFLLSNTIIAIPALLSHKK